MPAFTWPRGYFLLECAFENIIINIMSVRYFKFKGTVRLLMTWNGKVVVVFLRLGEFVHIFNHVSVSAAQ
jgi:hypothetical protein